MSRWFGGAAGARRRPELRASASETEPVEAVSRLNEIGVGRSLEASEARVERALAKLDEGTYGCCDGCGAPIAPIAPPGRRIGLHVLHRVRQSPLSGGVRRRERSSSPRPCTARTTMRTSFEHLASWR